MLVPSCSVCVLSELAVAEKGAPFTTFPPCNPSKPSNSMRSPNGPPGPGPPGPSPCSKAGGAGGSCALPVPKESTRAAARRELVKRLRFIIIFSSSLPNSKLVAENQIRLFRQAHCFRQSILADQQIHLNPIAHPLFIHRQAECAECAALHAHAYNGRIVHLLRQAPGQQCKIARLVVGNENCLIGRVARRHLCGRIGFHAIYSGNRAALSVRQSSIPPAHTCEQHSRCCQRPGRKNRTRSYFPRPVSHSKFMQ